MLAYTYIEQGKFELLEKQRPQIKDSRDAIVRVTLSSICTSDLHIKHGSVPRALPGITVGHEMVGIVEEIGMLADGTWAPGSKMVGIPEGICDYDVEGLDVQIPDDVTQILNDTRQLIADGKLVLPTDLDQIDD